MAPVIDVSILSLLNQSATSPAGIITYPQGTHGPPLELSYFTLREIATKRASWLRAQHSFRPGGVVLVHFKTQLDNIIWFWTCIFAGSVPALSPPLVNTTEGRRAHFKHLWNILDDPLVLARKDTLSLAFTENEALRVIAVDAADDLKSNGLAAGKANGLTSSQIHSGDHSNGNIAEQLKGVATVMLTSGSSGHSKAVCLSHEQILTSIRGKLMALPLPDHGAVLNWIGLDHVVSLIEMHLLAMYASVSQIQIQAVEVLSDPLMFLRTLSIHKISMTFAPDFFLSKLLATLNKASQKDKEGIDLSQLQVLTSGGELNNVDTGFRVMEHLHQFGVKVPSLIVPGFGMTEICAGGIFNQNFPIIDRKRLREFGVLGTPITGLEMRISPLDSTTPTTLSKGISDQANDSVGILELRGPIVFSRYLNDDEATQGSFTADGWFQTGDLGFIDEQGQLHLAGRQKELININSVKYLPYEIEDAIDAARIPGVKPSFVACFSHKESTTSPETIFVVYQHEYDTADIRARVAALHSVIRTVVLVTSARPQVLPLPSGYLQKSTLGKLSRQKIRTALLDGKYKKQEELNTILLRAHRIENFSVPQNETEHKLISMFQEALGIDGELDVKMPILDTGISSVELIKLKRTAEMSFGLEELPMIIILTNTTIRSLAQAIHDLQESKAVTEYKPVVTLQPHGTKNPLWLFHPGIGEILVFLGLAQYFPDRPIYAFRPRGFNPGERPFRDQRDLLETYYHGLREKQPKGPYALAGYSFGTVLAFELSKRLEAEGETVQFLASFNLPPHIKQRMRTLDWTAAIIHISHFCAIISQERADVLNTELRALPENEQIAALLAESDPIRTAELGLTPASLLTWANVALSLQKIGWEYDPSGTVSRMDIFYCQPLKDVASSREEYRNEKLNHWSDFVRDDLQYHEVGGEHYTMIGPEHLPKFQQTLKRVMAARGL